MADHRGRTAVVRLGRLTGGVLALCTVARWTRLDVHSSYLIAASTGAPVLLLLAWPLALLALSLREHWLALLAIVLIVVDLTTLVPLIGGGRGLTAAERRPGATRIRVFELNVRFDAATGAAVTRQVRAAAPDLVVLSELTPWSAAGLNLSQLPYSSVHVRYDDEGAGIWSRWPLEDVSLATIGGRRMIRAAVVLPDGQRLQLIQVHTRSPTSGADRPKWRRQLAGLADLLRHLHGPVVMAGDFNASRTDADFAPLLGGPLGMADAADGRGLLPTWPSGKRVIWPVLRLDHVLVSREVGVRRVGVLGPTGSDHRAVLADLATAAGP